MPDMLANMLRQRQLQQAAHYQRFQMQQRALAQRAQEEDRARREALMQQRLDQQAQISAGNQAQTTRRLDMMAGEMADRERQRQFENAARQRKEEKAEADRQLKLRGQHASDLGKLRSIDESTRDVVERINRVLAAPNRSWGFEPNFGGLNAEYIGQHLPVDRTQNTRKDLEALQSYFAMSGLQNLRGRTGQSVGAISEKEWPVIRSAYESLGPRMGEEAARQRLLGVKARALQMRNAELDLYNKEWGQTPFYEKQPFTTRPVETQGKTRGVPKGVDPEAWDNMTPEEQGLWLGTTK